MIHLNAIEGEHGAISDGASGSFGKYRLVRKLAAGGMAQIYLAEIGGPDGFSKTCVIKRILPQFAYLKDFAEMFVTEAKVAALLSHPNIVQVFDFGKIDDQYYLAMEFIDGPSLDAVMRKATKAKVQLGPRLAVHLGIPLCDALSYVQGMRLHDGTPLNLVHRDVTPGNVLISNSAEVKLTDFGVVKTSVNTNTTSAGTVKGKFAYMSPEQVEQRHVDHRSDIFSLGVVLYEVATGRRLWKRASLSEMIAAVSACQVPRPSDLMPGFPLGVERILLKALARDPDARYQSARDMMADLDTYRLSQQWSSGRRELASILFKLFPERCTPIHSSWSNAIPPLPSQALSRRPSDSMALTRYEPNPMAEDDGDLPHIVVSDAWWRGHELVLALVGGIVATALFWALVLS